jgi:hypothetical protein
MKLCSKCKEEKPTTEFYAIKRRDGSKALDAKCKECRRRYQNIYRTKNDEAVKKRKKVYYNRTAETRRAATREWGRKNPDRKREMGKKWRTANKERLRIQNACRHYKITPAQFKAIVKKQKGKCAICGAKSSGKRNLHIDHCHATGIVRGLLCGKCNTAIGMVNENISLLRKAYRYLLRFQRKQYRELLA